MTRQRAVSAVSAEAVAVVAVVAAATAAVGGGGEGGGMGDRRRRRSSVMGCWLAWSSLAAASEGMGRPRCVAVSRPNVT